ncbi:Na+/H+ antiporter family protein [Campylobacter geochelonis]|uniref:Transport protein n=1 Tax=Campylobacter geochelonis TaxID=1780362 RepID=A0A128EB01_9BACT|nr:Na+/H+ antiporter NhaC family protein [Campylobacter geochelonis]QKF72226.1 YuiF family protein, putative amino acid transporter [Campylobacter geochelonis]CZE46150.1 transport protein [Campylobacter geochelonis]CZE46477.1 transport protein [Campylobacter geochelonis]CZE50774.1 transport protein [Campylobacter geochelonis]
MLTNPVLISVILMMVLCLLRFNVMFAILVSAVVAGLVGGINLENTISTFINGMSGNLETALSYILLGILAAAISYTNLTTILINKISNFISHKKIYFILTLALIACCSQNLVPIHIAFIPILIPPLLPLMNKMKIDRRAVACALTFGLKAPYISLPVGFGLIFFGIIQKEMSNNGITVSIQDISSVMWMGAIPMIIGLILAIIVYRKPREYKDIESSMPKNLDDISMTLHEWGALVGIIVAFIVQIVYSSLPLGALLGIIAMMITGGIKYNKMEEVFDKGFAIMGFIAFVMLVASGYGTILRETGGISELVNAVATIAGGKLGGAILMLVIGLLVTMGIGSSFGTIPIIAAIYCPLCVQLGFDTPSIIMLIAIAAALGDAGSPASDSTLGPTSGLNFDGQHNHIYDTCVPTFIFYNIPLLIFGTIFAMIL